MNEVRDKLESVEQKQKRFKQQQFTFIAALEHCREHAHHRKEPVSSVAQVQRYLTHHCSSATDKRIISLFLDILADLEAVFQIVESSASTMNYTSDVLDSCRKLLSPDCYIGQLRAHYPHDEVNRLSCDEAQNYYGGVVSVIPLALDLLKTVSSAVKKASTKTLMATKRPDQPTAANNTGTASANVARRSAKAVINGADVWKPAWRSPGRKRI